MRRTRTMLLGLMALTVGPSSLAAIAEAGERTALTLMALSAPSPIEGSDGRLHLVYEVMLSNPSPANVMLQRADILDPATGEVRDTLERKDILGRLALGADRNRWVDVPAPGQFAVLFLHLALDKSAPVPERLSLRVTADFPPLPGSVTVSGGEVALSRAQAIGIGPPLRGLNFIAGDGCCDSDRHVKALLSVSPPSRHVRQLPLDLVVVDWLNGPP